MDWVRKPILAAVLWPPPATDTDPDVGALAPTPGATMTARGCENQQVEALVKGRVLNRMASPGLPISDCPGNAAHIRFETGQTGAAREVQQRDSAATRSIFLARLRACNAVNAYARILMHLEHLTMNQIQ